MHKPHVWADTQGSIVHQLEIGIYYFLPLGQNGNNILSSELLGQQNCIVPHTEELVMCLNGTTMWYNKNQEYDMRQDETWGIHTCVTTNCIRLRKSVNRPKHVPVPCACFLSSLPPLSPFFPLIFNKQKKYRRKWKPLTREENCWCLQDRSWAAVRAVALLLLMLFPRLTPPCKLQLWAGGSACSCVLCEGERPLLASSAFFRVQLKT